MRNRISFLDFKSQLNIFGVFTVTDALKAFPQLDTKRLTEWQHKNYITKLINGRYIFNDVQLTENVLFQISNALCKPSYISLESALSFYGLIPEQAFSVTAITTTKTKTYDTPKGSFIFRNVKPQFFFGYKILPQSSGSPVLMAEPEKALLDYLYLNTDTGNAEALKALRLNSEILKKTDELKIARYLERSGSNALSKRWRIFQKTLL